jgi:hypothetical protein
MRTTGIGSQFDPRVADLTRDWLKMTRRGATAFWMEHRSSTMRRCFRSADEELSRDAGAGRLPDTIWNDREDGLP